MKDASPIENENIGVSREDLKASPIEESSRQINATGESVPYASVKRRTRRIFSPVLGIFLAFGALLLVLGGVLLALTENPISEFAQQKLTSARYRLLEYFPEPERAELLPTPVAPASVPVFLDDAVESPEASNGTPEPTRVARPDLTAMRTATPARTPTPVPALDANVKPIQPAVALSGFKHDYQRWNNCGPVVLSMYLSYFGRTDTQTQVANYTKPSPDDKNVRADELAAYANRVGMRTLIRQNGTLDLLKHLLSNGLPVVAETAFVKQPQGWMGHYRLLVGYDEKDFNTYDSYDGPNVKISVEALDEEWRAFDRLYLVVYREDQDALVRAIVGEAMDDRVMFSNALVRAQNEMAANAQDAFAQFNYGSSLLGLKRYKEAAAAYDRARVTGLPWRMLWYQFGPYEAYLQAERYQEVITLADALLKTSYDLEESHYYRGLALQAMGRKEEARREFETALSYNKNYRDALLALESFK